MHQILTAINQQLNSIVNQIQSVVPNDEPFGNAHNNWSFPGLTKSELMEEAKSIIKYIDQYGTDELGDAATRLNDYIRRLQFVQQQTVAQLWGNSALAVPTYMFTLQGLRNALSTAFAKDEYADATAKLTKITGQIRTLEAKINGLQPRTDSLTTMVDRIERAHAAADQLPTDLETLSEARGKIAELATKATGDQDQILKIREKADDFDKQLKQNALDAEVVLARCETAYSAATSVGLAAAFDERSKALSKSIQLWVFGLAIALGTGGYFGSGQLHNLSELIKIPNAETSIVVLNLFLSLLSVGAPVWFAWLATKQIGQRFRLAEDYAFKASVSRAYEGFRRETARFDKDMEAKLLNSALTRLDEQPLRLVEKESHGSPWHELANSEFVKQAMRIVPGFADQVKDLAEKGMRAINTTKVESVPSQEKPHQ